MNRYGYTGPEQYRPLSPWAYFGYSILFAIPVIGWIALIVCSVSGTNVNRRSYARSYWCVLAIAVVFIAIVYITGGAAAILSFVKNFLEANVPGWPY